MRVRGVELVLRPDHVWKPGGDVLQANHYRDSLHRRGYFTKVSSLTPAWRPDPGCVPHLFNVDRTRDVLRFAQRVQSRPFVVSPIHHKRAWVDAYERVRTGKVGLVSRRFADHEGREYVKDLYRSFSMRTDPRPLLPVNGERVRSAVRTFLDDAAAIFCLAPGEAASLLDDYGTIRSDNRHVIPNAVPQHDSTVCAVAVTGSRDIDVLIAGRVEERKNTLAVAHALAASGLRVVFAGALNPSNPSYVSAFLRVIAGTSTLEYLGLIPVDEMQGLFLRSKVVVSAGYFEVVSLTELQASSLGCRLVTTPFGYTADFLGSEDLVANPYDLSGLADQVTSLDVLSPYEAQHDRFCRKWTWDVVGDRLADAYAQLRTL